VQQPTLTIGQVASRAGINSSAVRFYEREGVLPLAQRVSGQRRYGEETVRRLEVIDIAKRAGFNLDEIRLLLNDTSGELPLRELAQRKLPEVEALIARAEAMRDWLLKAQHCRCSSLELCALFARSKPRRRVAVDTKSGG
jgi:MerR family transcriptional regulator, redox-sensitive transcriptional activator SoxR